MNNRQEDPKEHAARLAAEQAVRDAIGAPIEVNRDGPKWEQNGLLGSVRIVNTSEGQYTVTPNGKVEKDGKIIGR